MNSIFWTIIGAVLAAIHWLLDTYAPQKPTFKNAIKTISLIIVLTSLFAAFFSVIESKDTKIASDLSDKKILQLENSELELKNKILAQEKETLRLKHELTEEKNRIKSVAMVLWVDLDGPWLAGTEPYSNKYIQIPLQDRALVFALPKQGSSREILSFFPSRNYSFVPVGQSSARFTTNLALRGDANLLGSSKNTLFEFESFRISVPLQQWTVNLMPVRVTNIRIQLTFNDTETYALDYPANLMTTPPDTQQEFFNSRNSFLEFMVKVKKKDYKITSVIR